LQQAATIAQQRGPGGVEQFLRQNGYPKSENWCGEFAASVVKSMGIAPPHAAAANANATTAEVTRTIT